MIFSLLFCRFLLVFLCIFVFGLFCFVVLFLVVFFFLLSLFLCVSFFDVLPFCPWYFSLILFISFSNYGMSLFSFFIFLLRMLCFGMSSSMRFFMLWNVHLWWLYPKSSMIEVYALYPSVIIVFTSKLFSDVSKNVFM